MRVTVLTCDAAQVDTSTGKVHALGLGWTRTSVPIGFMAVLVLLYFDEDPGQGASNQVTVTLADEAGLPVAKDDGSKLLEASATIARTEDMVNSSWPIMAPLVIPLPGLPVEPARTYQFRVAIDGKSEDSWFTTFSTDPAASE